MTARDTQAPNTDDVTEELQDGDQLGSGRVVGEVESAVVRDLARVPPDLATGALGLTARALARRLDDPDNSATSVSMCAGQLRDTMDRIRQLSPPIEEPDDIDELTARRARRDRLAKAADLQRAAESNDSGGEGRG